jgi:pyrimidine deaminase RibD-like protein
MIRSEILEHFLLGYSLAVPNNGLGRPTNIAQLEVAATEKCGDCNGEILDALYNLNPEHAELRKYAAVVGGGVQSPNSFEQVRNTPHWQDFITHGSFNIKVLPPGRIRFQRLDEQLQQAKAMQPLLDDRKFVRMAIDEARKSVSEKDDRVHPKVGAVVVKDGHVLSKAHRGEQAGNHAEFVALDKKLTDEAVAGATVYTTLEPCTTRNKPKIPCAERLIDRKVGRVVIGMLDPDDRISGKGVRKLRQAGIETVLFPHDLAMEVEELNREFIRFCEQNVRTEVGSANMELWKEISSLRADIAELKQSEKERSEFDNFPASFRFDQGSPGNYCGHFQNDSRYQVSIETIRILRGDTNYEAPLTEAVKARKTENWTFEPGESRMISWGPQYEPISMLKSLVQSPKTRYPDGEVIPIKIELIFTVEGKHLTKNFVRQVLFQGNQILTWGP